MKPRRHWSWILIAAPVVLLLVALVVIVQAKAFLRSERFRTFLSAKVSKTIKADGAFQPLEWSGSSFYSNGYSAIGKPEGPLEAIGAEQIRAGVNLQGLWERKWQIEHVEIERLRLIPANRKERATIQSNSDEKSPVVKEPKEAGVAKIPKPTPRAEKGEERVPVTRGLASDLLPNQVDVQHVSVANLTIDGKNLASPFQLDSLKVEAKPDGKAWMVEGSGGTLQFEKRPKISVNDLAVRYVDNTYFITRSAFAMDGGGTATINGQLGGNSRTKTDLNVKTENLPAAAVIPKNWRARVHGQLSADLHVVSENGASVVTGPVTLTNGELEALPILDQVAIFTRTQRFRQLHLETVHAEVEIRNGNVRVTNLDAESSGLVRMTGTFIIEQGVMTGQFLVGVTPASLRWIPGSQTKIFTEERGGYLWTPMKVSGPLAHLTEDLSERLAVAAGQDLIDTLQKDPSKLQDTLKDAAQSLLDLFKK